jgi:poly(hydroxyalkanoate) granule-associated protein
MARKSKAGSPSSAEALGQSVVDSAQKIWLAGLGAFSRARTEGDGLFNTLVEQGKGMRERAREAADQALTTARSQADATFSQAQGKWDKLEQVFEERVSRSLNRLGVMTREEMEDLNRQVQELNKSVQALMKAKSSSGPARPRAKAKKKASRKARRGSATRA